MAKTVMITGGNQGLGLATAGALATRGHRVVLACRDAARAADACERLAAAHPGAQVSAVALDTSSLASVRALVERWNEPLDALVLNAGVQLAGPVERTAEGFERTFATNHLGHLALARLLLPRMTAGAHVVFVASDTHDPGQPTGMPAPRLDDVVAFARGEAFADECEGRAGRRRYTTSKLCNVLCAYAFDRCLADASLTERARVNAFDPGLMPGTELARSYGAAARFAWQRLAPALVALLPNAHRVETSAERLAAFAVGGLFPSSRRAYISRGRVARSSARSYDVTLQNTLWRASCAYAGIAERLDAESP